MSITFTCTDGFLGRVRLWRRLVSGALAQNCTGAERSRTGASESAALLYTWGRRNILIKSRNKELIANGKSSELYS